MSDNGHVIKIKIHGIGGGGVVTTAELMAIALIEGENKSAQMFPTFGPERSGAPVTGSIRIGGRLVPTQIEDPDVLIVYRTSVNNKDVYNGIHEKTVVILDTPKSPKEMSEILKHPVWCLDATAIAREELKKDLPGIALFGAFVKATGLVCAENMYLAIRENFPGTKLRGNLRSAHRGMEAAAFSGDMQNIIPVPKARESKPGWTEIEPGAVLVNAGNSKEYNTGSWGKQFPLIDTDKCKLCMICWAMCPDNSLYVSDNVLKLDELHCKGCGICQNVCPDNFNAITMREKGESK